jgi:hypothetical protein
LARIARSPSSAAERRLYNGQQTPGNIDIVLSDDDLAHLPSAAVRITPLLVSHDPFGSKHEAGSRRLRLFSTLAVRPRGPVDGWRFSGPGRSIRSRPGFATPRVPRRATCWAIAGDRDRGVV